MSLCSSGSGRVCGERVGVAAPMCDCTPRRAHASISWRDPWARAPSVLLSCALPQEPGSPGLGGVGGGRRGHPLHLAWYFLSLERGMLIFLHLFCTIKASQKGFKVRAKEKHLNLLGETYFLGKDIFLPFCAALSLWINSVHYSNSNVTPRAATVVQVSLKNLDLAENKLIWSQSEFLLLGPRHGRN